MKRSTMIIQWLVVVWVIFCAFRITQHERDMYKAYYEIQMLRDGFKESICNEP